MVVRGVNKTKRDRRTHQPVERSELLRAAESGLDGTVSDEDLEILTEAYERFQYALAWESDFRSLYVEDVKFANADPDNGWQWPDDLRSERILQRRPTLTINKVQNHVNLVVNDGRQNKAAIQIKPAGRESSFAAAKGLEALTRNIEYQSTASSVYDDMAQSQVEGGIGYGRVVSVYPDPRSFNQELRIIPVQNHMNVFLDPDIRQKNGSDARWGFIFEDISYDEYERQTGEEADIGSSPLGMDLGADWVKPDHIRIAEYYRIKVTNDELIYFKQGDKESIFLRSEVPRGMKAALRQAEKAYKDGTLGEDSEVITRPTEIKKLEWFKIGAHRILDRKTYNTQYIPIFRFVGRERVIDNKLERKGLTRTLKDAQRMYNYNSSAEAEAAALATKTPWLAAVESIAGNETAWNEANVKNKGVLTFRHKDRDGDPIPPPQRIEPAKEAAAYLAGMEIASRELEMASGQGPAQFGKPTKERSGRAINETQRQGEILTFDFIDNQALGIQYCGMIILDWIPHCYDTKQVVQILDRDGTERMLTIDPNAQNAYEEQKIDEQVQAVLNPKIGRYKVQAQPGPAYATQRQEAWNAFVQIITGAPDLINEIGDLMFLSADFPMAEEISQRLRRKIKQLAPWLLDDNAVNPQVQALQEQINQAGQQIAELLQQLAEKDHKLRDQSEDIAIKAAKVSDDYRKTDIAEQEAHTRRITAISNAQLDLDRAGMHPELVKMIQDVVRDTLGERRAQDARLPIPQNSVQNIGEGDQEEGGNEDFYEPRQADDGNHYIRHQGRHYMVNTQAMNGGGEELA